MDREARPGDSRQERLHQRIWELLPWHVNGTLAAPERHSVEEHLASCPRCREEAERCREIGAGVAAAEEVAPSPHPVQLARLMARIDAAEAAAPRTRTLALSRFGGLLRATPPAARWLLAAQAAALLLLAGGLLWRERTLPAALPAPPASFHTLSEDPAAAPARGTRLRVLFADGTSEREMRDLLAAVRGQIVGGPSPIGAYVVEVPAGPDADPLPLLLAHLRSRRQVTFAEPVAGEQPAAVPGADAAGGGGER